MRSAILLGCRKGGDGPSGREDRRQRRAISAEAGGPRREVDRRSRLEGRVARTGSSSSGCVGSLEIESWEMGLDGWPRAVLCPAISGGGADGRGRAELTCAAGLPVENGCRSTCVSSEPPMYDACVRDERASEQDGEGG